ncbi:unnamed protein product, partial [Ectocarpus fasciculatus]
AHCSLILGLYQAGTMTRPNENCTGTQGERACVCPKCPKCPKKRSASTRLSRAMRVSKPASEKRSASTRLSHSKVGQKSITPSQRRALRLHNTEEFAEKKWRGSIYRKATP